MRKFFAVLAACLIAATANAATPLPGAISISGGGNAGSVPPAELAQWPAVQVNAMFGTANGVLKASFTGPLLWIVLCDARAVDPTKPRALVRAYAVITGADGYSTVLALGEIAPMFEGKQVILAETMNGKPLPPGQFRLIVPGDQRGGRDVKNVTRITVLTIPATKPQ